MKESERNLSCWLCKFCLGGTPASRIHHGLMLMAAPSQPFPKHPQHPLCPNSHPPLSERGKEDLTQKWVETNDSNESGCPLPMSAIVTAAPASVSKWLCFQLGKLLLSFIEQVPGGVGFFQSHPVKPVSSKSVIVLDTNTQVSLLCCLWI